MNNDPALLNEWTEKGSETAFAVLVSRYAGLVYGTALRVLRGDAPAAEDVTQTVFARLAQKAHGIAPPMLGAWLYRHAWAAAQNTLRQNHRRARREKEAVLMASMAAGPNDLWTEVAPHVDRAISKLGAKDQAALVLRFFQQKDFREVGQALGTNEDTAQKRVSRGLEKLRILLSREGIQVSLSTLPALLAIPSNSAAPATVITCASTAALAAAAAGTSSTPFLFSLMTATKFKTLVLSAILAGGVGAPLWLQHREMAALRQRNTYLQAQLQTERDKIIAAAVVPIDSSPETNANDQQFRELLRLRGETALLRRRVAELEKRATETAAAPSSGQDSIAAEELVFAGYADPASSLQTYLWALKNGDTNAFLKAVSPELAESYSQALNGPEPELIRQSLAKEIDGLKAIRVIDTQTKSPSLVVLTLQESGKKERRSLVTMLNIDGEWRILDKSSR